MIANRTSQNAGQAVAVCYWGRSISVGALSMSRDFEFFLSSSVPLCLCVSLLLLAVSPACAQDPPADLPIKRVVMFSSGVAFFEHAGQVDGNATVELKF